MNQYLKCYQVVMRTVGPVFIGSGREIGKKEYLVLNRKQAGIPDIQLLYAELKKKRKRLLLKSICLERETLVCQNGWKGKG